MQATVPRPRRPLPEVTQANEAAAPRRSGKSGAAFRTTAEVAEELDLPEREALRRAFGEGSTGKGVATAVRGAAGALK